MSPIAAQQLAIIHKIRKMDANPARFQWMRKLSGEADYLLHARRGKLLEAVDLLPLNCVKEWDALPESVRAKLGGAA